MFKLVQLAVVTLPVMYHQCTYPCSAVSEALYIISKSYIICSANKHNTVRALRNNVASITANYNKLSPQSQRQYHIANVNTYEIQIVPYYITQ
jgi:hypothetical protein